MQTFLPTPSFRRSLEVLDPSRLRKQILEAAQLLNGQFPRHPIAHAWRPYPQALSLYLLQAIVTAEERGIRHAYSSNFDLRALPPSPSTPRVYPWWLGHPLFHRSHRAALCHKRPDYYRPRLGVPSPQLDPDSVEQINYVWPVHRDEYEYLPKREEVVILRYAKPRTFPYPPPDDPHIIHARHKDGRPLRYLLQP